MTGFGSGRQNRCSPRGCTRYAYRASGPPPPTSISDSQPPPWRVQSPGTVNITHEDADALAQRRSRRWAREWRSSTTRRLPRRRRPCCARRAPRSRKWKNAKRGLTRVPGTCQTGNKRERRVWQRCSGCIIGGSYNPNCTFWAWAASFTIW